MKLEKNPQKNSVVTAKNNLETEFPTFLVFVNEARIGIFQSDTISGHIRQIPKKS